MKRHKIFSLAIAGLAALCGSLAQELHAEIWTDQTGQHKIDAEYAGVEGTNLVLRKSDGSTVKVPISRLSPESRELAKKLYASAKGGPATESSKPDAPSSANDSANVAAAMTPASSAPLKLDFVPPVSPPVPPLPAFPVDASLQEAVDFARTQFMAGHPEVFWYAMPGRLRSALDSPEYREAILPQLEKQAQFNDAIMTVVMKAVEILVTKKDFVLNSPLMSQVPPPFVPMVRQSYDPAVGSIYEFAMLIFVVDEMKSKTLTQMVDERGPRLGGHLQALFQSLPPGMVDQVVSQVQITQDDATNGSIQLPGSMGSSEPMQMKKVDGYWLPAELAEKWEENADDFVNVMKTEMDKMEAMQAENEDATQQANSMMGTAVTMVGGVLDPLVKAETQQEFDAGLAQIMMMASMFSQAGAGGIGVPGGPGAGVPPLGAGGF